MQTMSSRLESEYEKKAIINNDIDDDKVVLVENTSTNDESNVHDETKTIPINIGATNVDPMLGNAVLEKESIANAVVIDERFPGIHVNFNDYPPVPVVWLCHTIDTICWIGNCEDWRNSSFIKKFTNDQNNAANTYRKHLSFWFSEEYKSPNVAGQYPPLLSYSDFVSSRTTTTTTTTFSDHMQNLYVYSFQTSSTKLGSVGTSFPSTFMLLVLVVILRQIKSILIPFFSYSIGKPLAIKEYGSKWITIPENSVRIEKFGEYCFRLLYHSIISLYGYYYFTKTIWWNDTHYLFYGFPYNPIEPVLTWYYLFQAAYNLDAFYSLLVLSFEIKWYSRKIPLSIQNPTESKENCNGKHYDNNELSKVTAAAASTTKSGETLPNRRGKAIVTIPYCCSFNWKSTVRGDFNEMFIHHVATNVLVIGSSAMRLNRVGAIVFLLHDISDVPVDLSKLANFLKWKFTTLICFCTMVVTWFYTRLYLLPVWIFYKSIIQHDKLLVRKGLSPLVYLCYRDIFYAGMVTLIVLHFTWFLMFLKMLLSIVMKWEFHDYSEHKKGEQDETALKKRS